LLDAERERIELTAEVQKRVIGRRHKEDKDEEVLSKLPYWVREVLAMIEAEKAKAKNPSAHSASSSKDP